MGGLAGGGRSFGVGPAAVVGHSQVEIAAAYVAGALSLEDAVKVVCLRSQAIAAMAGTGAMASINATAERVEELVAGRVAIAAVNGPQQVVISGEATAVEQVVAECVAMG